MEVAVPPPTMDFDFDDARPLPFLSAPSTPKRFGDFSLSAPTSPSRMAEFYNRFDDAWDSIPPTPKSPNMGDNFDFAFDFKSELVENSLTAEELFDGGKIRPLKPPPRLQVDERSPLSSPRSPRSPIAQGKKIIREVFSPRKKKVSDPFALAAANTRKKTEDDRGRERTPGLGYSSSRKGARSLSPYRVSEYPWEEDERRLQELAKQQTAAPNSKGSMLSSNSSSSSSSSSVSTTTKSSSRKWRLRDFLLFRSASEGRASDKDPFRSKYPSFFRKPEDTKNTSFRSTDSTGSRRKGRVSAHELHYTTNKAASEDLKKKTFLPYKQGILGRFAFNPGHVNGFGNLSR
ncbi:hypothetical protein JCGZ_04319 [Jatropha curcas]|uniref:Uncharacterized protein n=2 Tax=Jatropha curcas TaxID=180498 RepID=A0A067L2R1_JATCU|nr:hypothetical protein JCGZ_04319 [Jatropha curcas]